MDTHFAAQAIRNYYADFMRLKTAQTPPGDIAYINLLGQLSAELEGEYPGEGGTAVAACGSAITSSFVDIESLLEDAASGGHHESRTGAEGCHKLSCSSRVRAFSNSQDRRPWGFGPWSR